MKRPIKLLVPWMPTTERLLPYLRRIDGAQWYTNFGVLERELRTRLEKKYGAYVVTVSSCTAGLELMYRHLHRDLGMQEIGLPSLTFPATIMAAEREGLQVKFEDVDPLTWTHPAVAGFGASVEGEWIDAAAAFGEQEVRHFATNYGQTAVFSLHATKPVGAGEGGYIVTHDSHLAHKFRLQTNFGIDQTAGDRRCVHWGTNAKLSEYHAAVALASLDAYDRPSWQQLDMCYRTHLYGVPVVQQLRPVGAYPILAVKLPHLGGSIIPAMLIGTILNSRGIETRRWYWPQMHSYYPGVQPELPETQDLGNRLLGLPYHLWLSEDDVAYVCENLADVLRECGVS